MENALTIQQIVEPSQIEPELIRIWEELAEKNKIRASLFNLIVFTKNSPRTDYFRNIVQKVVEKFPCRTIFISHDPEAPSYLKTAISVVTATPKEDASIACDQIDVGVGGCELLEKVFFLILPHLIPDLPINLLWAEDPTIPHPLFEPLSSLSNRMIFDSECADNLGNFAKKLLELKKKKVDIADLNWARTEGWRDLIASSFDARKELLKQIDHMLITYNEVPTEFFCHLKVQALYLFAWGSARLNWKKGPPSIEIKSEKWEKLGPGTIIGVEIHTKDEHLFQAKRIFDMHHYVQIQFTSSDQCDLPYRYVLGQTATGQSLVREITRKGTSLHYLEMLEELIGTNDANIQS